ncbi:MAG: UDP-N-acetylmuramoyl-L-alanyl-D-glutamate--2,6-diaminopimelate ligase [Defluviitaleaceae bacterium]|nr:UDP-N-acetylmuramoyl-L-alanyl-D-glutamate--2,6-diaminopimelate ligase [Defluviitaleaceae bacterium]
MNLAEIFQNIPHTIKGRTTQQISALTHDSRKVEHGTLFICLRGLSEDGHDYIPKAIEAGAAVILAEEFAGNPPEGVAVILVENTRKAMAYAAANFYGNPAKNLRLIGVTGTNGKTTTTYFIEEILRHCGRKTGLIGTTGIKVDGKNFDFKFDTDTTPDAPQLHELFAKLLQAGVTDVAMEVSSHALALDKVEGLTFDVGVFTNLTQDHLDFHKTMHNYRLAKAKLFAQSRFAVVNSDDASTEVMLQHHGSDPYLTYSIENKSDLRATSIDYLPQGSTFEVSSRKFNLPINGRFNIYNTLAAVGAALALGITMDAAQSAVARLTGVDGRIQSVPNNSGVNVLVDYAHSPDGLENIIRAVREFTTGRVITIFGCGGDRDKTKRPIMGKIAATLSDHCILTSDNPRTEDPHIILSEIEQGLKNTTTPYAIHENRREAIFQGVKLLNPGDALIIAGKGHEDYQIIGKEKRHFSDYEVAVEALS